MSNDDRARPDAYWQPDPGDFNFRPLLEAFRECRLRVGEMMSVTGARTQLYVTAESLLDQIDMVARLSRVPAAVKFVRRKKEPKTQK
jgi:hypothetical protein